MRRAIRFGDQLGFKDLFFFDVAARAVDLFAGHYPELSQAKSLIDKVCHVEEEAFRRTLAHGVKLFLDVAVPAAGANSGTVPGDIVFDLKATYGFPHDLTAQMAREAGLSIDEAAYQRAEAKHAEASAGDLGVAGTSDLYKQLKAELGATNFRGYEQLLIDAKVVALVKDGVRVGALSAGERGLILLDQTPFYGESGGQVGDSGVLTAATGSAEVDDTKKQVDLHLHAVAVKSGVFKVGDVVSAQVNKEALERTRRNHSATHLLHHALRKVLGDHVTQKGSLVAPDRLRFDFSHFEAMSKEQLAQVEDLVNTLVLDNHECDIGQMGFDDAKKKGAMALFGEKYGDRVRVVGFGPSVELCGGQHVRRTGDIGLFKITAEGPLAAGVRRLEAVTGRGSVQFTRRQSELLGDMARSLKVAVADLPERLDRLQEQLRAAEKELTRQKQKAQTAAAGDAVSNARDVRGIKVLAQKVTDVDPKNLREFADKLRDQLKSGVVVLGASTADEKVALLVAVTPDLVSRIHAGKMVGELAQMLGGKGGGKPEMAQAGGSHPERLDEVFAKAIALVESAAGG
jgi:alanyl-tRNA synthetase